ncbi:MAG: hypothetical protein NVS2B12_40310 [Ktedonobacteraceae bacterium]
MQLQTQFANRDALSQYLRAQFPAAALRSSQISSIPGGRMAAEAALKKVDPERYASTRNMLTGAVTRLSPYLRHGVLTLAEVRSSILERTPARQTYKILQELAWRDYYQRVYEQLGNDVWQDIEPYKTGLRKYAQQLPDDIKQGTTGLTCIDSFAHDLHNTGYLHNHARMWTAAYVVHHRRVRWQAGAYWFLQHLLDGDPASNNLSWQWVASTFAAKPYYFNRENLARYTKNMYCSTCPLLNHGCPFDGSYEDIEERLFPAANAQREQQGPSQTMLMKRLSERLEHAEPGSDNHSSTTVGLVWVNDDSLATGGPALAAHPQASPIFVFDEAMLENAGWTLKRIAFVYECLLEISGIEIHTGSPVEILTALLAQRKEQSGEPIALATTISVDPRLQHITSALARRVPIRLYEIEPYVRDARVRDLRRFSRYWNDVEHEVASGEV